MVVNALLIRRAALQASAAPSRVAAFSTASRLHNQTPQFKREGPVAPKDDKSKFDDGRKSQLFSPLTDLPSILTSYLLVFGCRQAMTLTIPECNKSSSHSPIPTRTDRMLTAHTLNPNLPEVTKEPSPTTVAEAAAQRASSSMAPKKLPKPVLTGV